MFGDVELRTQIIKIGGERIHILEETDEILLYKRDNVQRIIKKGSDNLKILPSPAVGYGVKLLMVKFKEPLTVPPGDAITGFVEAPIEVEVKVGNLTIDHFFIGREKYALYGTVENGVIVRYHVTDFYFEEPNSIGAAKIVVSNPSNEWKMLERIVIPIKGSVMFYNKEKAYYPLLITTVKNHTPEVNNTGKPPKEGLNATKEALSLPNFLMRW
ncbi:hypothetical protein PAP_09300 [Palaeococcus pacificus DY20341]|uniref:DUF432 domain-containing protein n=1 Tax=Palaeococcus pacificus DY20341 TaxID=1343739 RepID=A0A075M0C2_9EURY|nr:DUF432 domain-containing protein [Palaeococcus pacificus]AIF70238.1 hypothetical protein PAP_09300 [Palaeococcus pacificus DY20341]